LQAVLETNLQQIITPLRDAQYELNDGQKRLLAIADENQAAIRELADTLKLNIEQLRVHGVAIAATSQDKFADVVAGRVLAQLQGRLREEDEAREKVAQKFREHVSRTQTRSVELIQEKKFDRATDELRAGLELLQSLMEQSPGEIHLLVQLGYFFKTMAQHFIRSGLMEQGEAYNDQAQRIFHQVAHGIPHNGKSVRDYVDALNGAGNILYARQQYKAAISYYTLATMIDPLYCYAWHDMFAAYYALAYQGEVSLPAMRNALDMTRRTGAGQPGLSEQHLAELAALLGQLERAAGRVAPTHRKPPDRDQYEQALKVYQQQLVADPNNVEALVGQGLALAYLDRAEDGLKSIEQAIAVRPDFAPGHSARGAVLIGAGRIEEGIQACDEALRLWPEFPEPLYNKACAFSLSGEGPAALDLLERAIVAYDNFRDTAQNDHHLEFLRNQPQFGPRFRSLLEGKGAAA
jgi:tetratricopeptide (TPR) repeat protein